MRASLLSSSSSSSLWCTELLLFRSQPLTPPSRSTPGQLEPTLREVFGHSTRCAGTSSFVCVQRPQTCCHVGTCDLYSNSEFEGAL